VGFALYMELLERAVAALRRGEIPDADGPLERSTEVKLHLPALIPEDYLPDINTRLILYKRIAAAADEASLREIQVEMIDRFGLLTPAIGNLFACTRLRLKADSLGIRRIELGERGGNIDFQESTRVNPLSLVKLVQGEPQQYRLAGATRLRLDIELDDPQKRLQFIDDLLDNFAADATEQAA
jgi:transcription-repair coupling factor (superfamily II helicase)